jgi:hypothetical protein
MRAERCSDCADDLPPPLLRAYQRSAARCDCAMKDTNREINSWKRICEVGCGPAGEARGEKAGAAAAASAKSLSPFLVASTAPRRHGCACGKRR